MLNKLLKIHIIKNYQQIKQILNILTIKYQSNFFGYDFDSLYHNL